MDTRRSSFDLVRVTTDAAVLSSLMQHRRLTRAELAAKIGISKPTAGESVRRLAERGLVADTGERTPGGRGRGRVGSYYALAADVGVALAVSIAPEGVVAECVDAYGDPVARAERQASRPARPAEVAAALREAVDEVGRQMTGPHREAEARIGRDVIDALWETGAQAGDDPDAATRRNSPDWWHRVDGLPAEDGGSRRAAARPRVAVVSAADPVDRATGRLVHLPDAPFLVGALDPVEILGPVVDGPVIVDNDVNWAARAERDRAGEAAPDDFAYLFLGEGLGCALVSDGAIRRGAAGLAGEVAHLVTMGPEERAVRLIEVFGMLGLRRPGSTAIDVARVLDLAARDDAEAVAARGVVAGAVAGAVAAVVALADPERVVVGGPWGTHPRMLAAIREACAALPRRAPIEAAAVTDHPALAGARVEAVARLRAAILDAQAEPAPA